MWNTLQRRHNGHGGVSNHQSRYCLLIGSFRRRSKKTSKLGVSGLCEGNSPVTGEFPHKRPVTRKIFPFDDVIMTSGNISRIQNYFLFYPIIWNFIYLYAYFNQNCIGIRHISQDKMTAILQIIILNAISSMRAGGWNSRIVPWGPLWITEAKRRGLFYITHTTFFFSISMKFSGVVSVWLFSICAVRRNCFAANIIAFSSQCLWNNWPILIKRT